MKRFSVADGLLFACVVIWGFNITAVKLLLQYVDPLALAAVRFTIATTVFAVVVPAIDRSTPIPRRALPLLAVAGLCGIWLNQIAFTYGLQNTTAASMALLFASMPIFAGVGAWLLGWENPGARHWAGILAGIAGVALVVLGAGHQRGHPASLAGDFLGLLTAASFAAYSLLLRPLMRVYSALRISLVVSAVGLLGLAPLGFMQISHSHFGHFHPVDWFLLVYSSVCAVVLTNILWYTGVHRLGPSRATVYANVQPFVGVLCAVIILSEPIFPLQILGGAVILGGLVFGRERYQEAVPAVE